MSWSGPGFVLAIIAISTIGWVITTAIRARHGYPLENEWGGSAHRGEPEQARKVELLTQENEALHGKIDRLEERISVLERIATDPAERTRREIESLRDS
jgi:hypothetical protein